MTGILNILAGSIASAIKDGYFNLTTLLLSGNGTNGAQNNTFLDSSSNNFTITRNGNTTQGTFSPFSQTGWSGYFDGASDYIQYTNSDFSVSTGDFTAEWWMFITSDKSQVGIMTASTNSNLTIGYGSGTANARQPYVEWGGTGAYIGTMSNYMNTWVHICVMRSSGTVYTFQNGTLLSSASKSAAVGSTANMVIGTNAGDVAGQGVPGYLSNVRFAKAAIYSTSGFTAPTSPLTRTSQSATNVQFLTLQSNRFLDSNGVNTPASSPLAITRNGDTSIQAFSPFAPTAAYDAATNGGSGYFDGSGDYLSVSSGITNAGTNDLCVEFFAYYTGGTFGDYKFVFDSRTSGGSFLDGVAIAANTGTGAWYVSWAGQEILGSAKAGAYWNHVCLTRQSGVFRLFVDGVLQGTYTPSPAQNYTSTTNRIGWYYGATTSYQWSGYISGFRTTKSAVPTTYQTSSTTVGASIFTPPSAPLTTTSQGASGTSFLLNFTNAGITDATAKNDLETVGNAQISTTQSKFGGSSIYLDGTGDWLLMKSSPNFAFGTGDFTLEMWAYFSSVASFPTLTDSRATSASTSGFNLGLSSAKIQIYTTSQVLIGATALSTNTWYHIAVTRSGSTLRIFLNGTQDASTTNSTNWSDQTLIIGATPDLTNTLNGYIDDLRITKGYARYTGNFTAPTAAFALQ